MFHANSDGARKSLHNTFILSLLDFDFMEPQSIFISLGQRSCNFLQNQKIRDTLSHLFGVTLKRMTENNEIRETQSHSRFKFPTGHVIADTISRNVIPDTISRNDTISRKKVLTKTSLPRPIKIRSLRNVVKSSSRTRTKESSQNSDERDIP